MSAKMMVALITPYNEDLTVDTEALKKLVEHCRMQGAEGFVVCGTTGESCFLNEDEKLKILKTVLSCVHKEEVWMGIGTNCTETTLEFLKKVEEYPIEGVMAVVPYYVRPSQKGMFMHFSKIAEATDKKVMIYNVPKRCGSSIEVKTLIELAEKYPNIYAYKHASSNLSKIGDLLALTQHLEIYSGEDELLWEGLEVGMSGIISVMGHVYGKEICELILESQCGIVNQELINKIKHASYCVMKEGNPSGIKAACFMLGLCRNTLRLPLAPVSSEAEKMIRECLQSDKKIS